MNNLRRMIRRRNVDQSVIAKQVGEAAEKLSDTKTLKMVGKLAEALEERELAEADLKIAEHEISVLKKQVENLQSRVQRLQELNEEYGNR